MQPLALNPNTKRTLHLLNTLRLNQAQPHKSTKGSLALSDGYIGTREDKLKLEQWMDEAFMLPAPDFMTTHNFLEQPDSHTKEELKEITSQSKDEAPSPEKTKQKPNPAALLRFKQALEQPLQNQGLVEQPKTNDNPIWSGEPITFEDLLMKIMMHIAQEEEKQILEKLDTIDKGNQGMLGYAHRGAEAAGGLVGGSLGGLIGGQAGVGIGHDLGKRAVQTFTGHDSKESRQIQFEKLKMMMNKLNEMMSCISNILASNHQTVRNTITNIKG